MTDDGGGQPKASSPGYHDWTVSQAIAACERGRDTAVYLGGGVAGLAIVGSGDLANTFFDRSPNALMPTFITLLLISTASLAMSYRAYDRQVLLLKRDVADHKLCLSDPSPALDNQKKGLGRRRAALITLVLSAACMLTAVWWTI